MPLDITTERDRSNNVTGNYMAALHILRRSIRFLNDVFFILTSLFAFYSDFIFHEMLYWLYTSRHSRENPYIIS